MVTFIISVMCVRFITVLECSVDAEVVYRVCRSFEYPFEVPVLIEHHARPRIMLDALDCLLQVPERKKYVEISLRKVRGGGGGRPREV